MTTSSLIINIIADLCPHGMLPLAYGLSRGPTGIVPALSLLGLFAALSAYTMTTLADLARLTESSSLSEIWAKLVGRDSKWIIDAAVLALCTGCCIFYSAFIGDIFAALASAAGISHGPFSKRWSILAFLSAAVLLPLCELSDLSALASSSLLGVAGILYTALFHAYRLWDHSYSLAHGGRFAAVVEPSLQRESSGQSLWTVNSSSLVLINMLCVAFLAHYNAVNYYSELGPASISTTESYRLAVTVGFSTAASVFAAVMLLGYALFGGAAQPLVLNNFHRTLDVGASLARLATGAAIAFAYPLMFAGVKSSLRALLFASSSTSSPISSTSDAQQSRIMAQVVTPGALALITAVALGCGEEDVSLVLGVVGSLLGCSVAYVLPSWLVLAHQRQTRRKIEVVRSRSRSIGSESYKKEYDLQAQILTGSLSSRSAVLLNHMLLLFGAVVGLLGAWVTLESAAHPHSPSRAY